jgi:carbon starvation protein
MFGVANQMLAVIALAIISVYLVNEGKEKYLWVTVLPMLFVMSTTSTAAIDLLEGKINTLQAIAAKSVKASTDWANVRSSIITGTLLVAMLGSTLIILVTAGIEILGASVPAESEGSSVR